MQVAGPIFLIRNIVKGVGACMANPDDTREEMTQQTQILELAAALKAAGSAHHEYEQTALDGVFDEQWPMFYAAFVLGRIGDFATPSALMSWLEEVPSIDGVWTDIAARHVIGRLGPRSRTN